MKNSASLAVWNVNENDFPKNGEMDKKLKFLIRYAILAPSGHNSQPWRFLINNSSIELKNKELKYLEVEQGIKADLITLYSAYNNNLRLIKMEEQNLRTATENLDIALERYKLGSLSGIDLREVQKSLLDAKERLLSVEYQAKLAEISLQLISGKIMAYYK